MKSLLSFFLSWLFVANCFANDGVIEYTTTPGAIASKTYSLFVNGKEIFVERFKDISYARFAFNGKVNVKINVVQSFDEYKLSPVSYAIPSQKSNNTIAFELNRSRKLIVQIKGIDEKLFVFADDPEKDAPKIGDKNVTSLLGFVSDNKGAELQTGGIQKAIDQVSKKGGVLFVPNGKYLTGTFIIRKNVTLYLESGALIQGSGNLKDYNDNGDNKTKKITYEKGALIYFDKADNAKIMGRGTIAMQGTKVKAETGVKIRTCNLRECKNAGIYDVVLRDAGGFNIHILHSSGIMMKGYKIINDLSLPNQDGTDPDGSNGVTVDDVFMYTSDDAIAVKADSRLCENVLVKNCVFWTVKSALKVGSDPYFNARNIIFQNNDVVHADRALALYAGKGNIEQVKFVDNKSEDVGGNAKQQLIVFQVSNAKEESQETERRGIGYIKNVQVINYTAYQQSPKKSLVSGTVSKDGALHKVSDVVFKNLVIEGKHCLSAEDAGIILTPKELPVDPNLPPKDIEKIKNSIAVENPLQAVENIRFE
jgi:hypothetical protein